MDAADLGRCARLASVAILLSAAICLAGLGRESLWFDELLTAVAARSSSVSELITEHLRKHTHPPGYGLFLYGWVRLFGSSEAALRLPSALAGIASIVLFPRLMLRVLPAGIVWIATILLALTYPVLYYAHEARPYTLLLLFSIGATATWLEVLGAPERREPKLRYFVWAFLAIHTHYYGLVLVGTQGLAALVAALRKRSGLGGILAVAALLILSYVPWLAAMSDMASGYWGAEQAGRPGLRFLLFWLSFNFTNKPLLAFLVCVALFALPARRRWPRLGSDLLPLAYLVLFPMLVLMVISQHTNILGHRYLIVLCPAVHLLAAAWIHGCFERPSAACRWTLAVCLIALAIEVPKYRRSHKEQWREAATHAVSIASERSEIAVLAHPELFAFYLRRAPAQYGPNTLDAARSRGARELLLLRARVDPLSPAEEADLTRRVKSLEKTSFRHATVYRLAL